MAVNPAGFVPVFDGGAPRIIGGMATSDMSGGQFVFASGAADSVSSGINSFVTSDIKFCTGASGNQFVGLAIQAATSGGYCAVATDCVAIVRAFNTVTAGTTVTCEGTDAVATGATAGQVIGRALNAATSGGYCIVQFGRN